MVVRLWKDGFTVNDEEFRSYSIPENQNFLDAIKRGCVKLYRCMITRFWNCFMNISCNCIQHWLEIKFQIVLIVEIVIIALLLRCCFFVAR